jgi:hypothetical protein
MKKMYLVNWRDAVPFINRRDTVPFNNQCYGYGSVGSIRFWASKIQIRHYLYKSNGILPLSSKKKERKTLISTVLWLLYDFLSMKTDVNVPLLSNTTSFFLSLLRSNLDQRFYDNKNEQI